MNAFQEYTQQAMSYRLPTADQSYVTYGLIGEVGELYGAIAKAFRDETTLTKEYIKKELGDILWFVAALCQDAGTSLDEVARINLEKLESRKIRGVLTGSGDDR
jgi:NTP pyrophosphatase (non-canonical NTP hydrolase)